MPSPYTGIMMGVGIVAVRKRGGKDGGEIAEYLPQARGSGERVVGGR